MLRATPLALVRSPARPTISAKKKLCNPASGGTLPSTAIEIIYSLKFAVAKAKVFAQLKAWVQRTKGGFHLLRSRYSSENNFVRKKCKALSFAFLLLEIQAAPLA
jgi:hypothetical protein